MYSGAGAKCLGAAIEAIVARGEDSVGAVSTVCGCGERGGVECVFDAGGGDETGDRCVSCPVGVGKEGRGAETREGMDRNAEDRCGKSRQEQESRHDSSERDGAVPGAEFHAHHGPASLGVGEAAAAEVAEAAATTGAAGESGVDPDDVGVCAAVGAGNLSAAAGCEGGDVGRGIQGEVWEGGLGGIQ